MVGTNVKFITLFILLPFGILFMFVTTLALQQHFCRKSGNTLMQSATPQS